MKRDLLLQEARRRQQQAEDVIQKQRRASRTHSRGEWFVVQDARVSRSKETFEQTQSLEALLVTVKSLRVRI